MVIVIAILLISNILFVSFATLDYNNLGTLDFAGGNGTVDDPYLIENITHLQNMDQDMNAHYKLADNIDASETSEWYDGHGFKPIGNSSKYFKGSLDGDGYTINGLYINRKDTDNIGLIGYLDDLAMIHDVNLLDVNITGYLSVGGLVGRNNG
ncbi:MAG: GLUG motif-containing protein, partial [Thermoplasmatota archaeon]